MSGWIHVLRMARGFAEKLGICVITARTAADAGCCSPSWPCAAASTICSQNRYGALVLTASSMPLGSCRSNTPCSSACRDTRRDVAGSGPWTARSVRSPGPSPRRTRWSPLSRGIRAQAKRRQVHYSFLFMRANGGQLAKITSLIDDGIIRPVVDRVFPFASTKDAMAYVEAGRAKGKVVVSVRGS